MKTNPRSKTSRSRRQFLQQTTSLAAAGMAGWSFATGTKASAAAVAPSERITIGCIGVGNQGLPVMQRFMQHPDCQVVAVCDVNQGSFGYNNPKHFYGREPAKETVEAFYAEQTKSGTYRGCTAHKDFREILERPDIDAVVICTPDHWHAEMTVLAARAGKDIYCEKPLSLTIGDGQAMVKAVRQHDRILQTGSHQRSLPAVRRACELARNGYLGEIKRVLTHVGPHNKVGPGPGWQAQPVPEGFDYDFWLGPAPQAPYHPDRCLYRFRFIDDYSGGQVTNFGAHSLDMAQWGLGMDGSGPVEVEYIDAKYLPKGSLFTAATHTEFRCRYANGVELNCKTAEPAARVVFEGTEGRVSVDHGGRNLQFSSPTLESVVLREEELLSTSEDHLQDFLDSVKSRKDPVAPVEVGHRSATVCHLGNIAIKLKAKLNWDPATEQFVGHVAANEMLQRPKRSPWNSVA